MLENLRVLVVDDDPVIVDAYRDVLESRKMEVSSIATYSAFAQKLDEWTADASRISTDIVLLDIWLGEQSSLELLAKFASIEPEFVPTVVVVSGASDSATAAAALRKGAHDFLEKPAGRARLLATLEKAREAQLRARQNVLERTRKLRANPIIGSSDFALRLREQVARVANTELSVLITGPTGTGKELVAQHIHYLSARSDGPFVAINCGALPRETMEAELFGYAKGAFTGASQSRTGLIASAQRGTLFLDEIGEMPPAMQVALLRVLETRKIRPLGSDREVPVDVRLVAATHQNVSDPSILREDLYHRINGYEIQLVSLQARNDDIAEIAEYFTRSWLQKNPGETINSGELRSFVEGLASGPLTGNIRELRQRVERFCVLGARFADSAIPVIPKAIDGVRHGDSLGPWTVAKDRLMADYLRARLAANECDKQKLAQELDLHPNNLYRLLKRYEIQDSR